MTLGTDWGWTPNPRFKTARRVIGTLAEITAKGGSLVLGVGPTPSGIIEDKAVVILQEIGEWLRRNGEAIYGTRITEKYNDGQLWFNASKDGKTLYAVYALKDGESLPASISWEGGNVPVGKVTVLNNGRKVRPVIKNGRVIVTLPKGLKDEPVAIKISL